MAGILILITKPFVVGDQIVFKNYEGEVEDIQTRATYIKTYCQPPLGLGARAYQTIPHANEKHIAALGGEVFPVLPNVDAQVWSRLARLAADRDDAGRIHVRVRVMIARGTR